MRGSLPVNLAPAARAAPARAADAASTAAAAAIPSGAGGGCNMREWTEYWGDALKYGPHNKQPTWEACCESCRQFRGADGRECNVWVYCGTRPARPAPEIASLRRPAADDARGRARAAGDAAACGDMHRDCWLKYDRSKKEYGPQIHAEGAGVMWTSGSSFVGREYDARTPTGRKYHVIITSSMSVYQQWQSRVRARGPCAAAPPRDHSRAPPARR